MNKTCARCGSSKDLEKHHVVPKSEGGSNSVTNLKKYCASCHDFIHTQRAVKKQIEYHEKHLELLRHRLNVLENLNSVDLIKSNGYRSYWIDETTHGDSDRKFRRRRKKKK